MSTMITDLEAKMSTPFNPAAPIKDLFVQISEGQDLAVAAGMPYLDIQLVTKTYDLIYKTGIHNNACKEWNRRAMARKTYARLQEHFTTAHRELRQLQAAARQLGYTANNAKYVEQEDDMQHRTVKALTNLADTTTGDHAAMANLFESNTELANQVIDMADQLKKKKQ
eukprot:13671883-Ditylum_brightwellii.AAC.1